MPDRSDHGWWPYLLPIFAFIGLVEISGRIPAVAAPYFLFAKVVVPFGLFLYFVRRDRYPELRGYRATEGGINLAVLVGLVGAVMWMAPYLVFDVLRPGAEEAFDPKQLGDSFVPMVLALRVTSYAVVIPFIEELFVRSWLLRYAEVLAKAPDFRDVPIAHFSRRSFLIVCGFFLNEFFLFFYFFFLAHFIAFHLAFVLFFLLVALFANVVINDIVGQVAVVVVVDISVEIVVAFAQVALVTYVCDGVSAKEATEEP